MTRLSKLNNMADLNQLETIYYKNYKQLMMNRIEWLNLPEGVKSEYLEGTLFDYGAVCFFFDEAFGYLALPPSELGLNIYGEPKEYIVTGINYNKQLNSKNSIYIKNNYEAYPCKPYITSLTKKLAEIDITIDVNVRNQKTPHIILTSKNMELSMKKIFQLMNENEQAIFVDEALGDKYGSGKPLTHVMDTTVPFVAENLIKVREKYESMLLTYIGLNNVNYEKKERLIVDEVTANNEHIHGNIDIMLEERKRACKLINDMYKLNIDVKIREHKEEASGSRKEII